MRGYGRISAFYGLVPANEKFAQVSAVEYDKNAVPLVENMLVSVVFLYSMFMQKNSYNRESLDNPFRVDFRVECPKYYFDELSLNV